MPKPFTAEEEAGLRKLAASWPEKWDVPRLLATLDLERATWAAKLDELEGRESIARAWAYYCSKHSHEQDVPCPDCKADAEERERKWSRGAKEDGIYVPIDIGEEENK